MHEKKPKINLKPPKFKPVEFFFGYVPVYGIIFVQAHLSCNLWFCRTTLKLYLVLKTTSMRWAYWSVKLWTSKLSVHPLTLWRSQFPCWMHHWRHFLRIVK